MTSVLIVDDDEQLPRVVARILTQYDFDCRIATNVDDGLAAAKKDPPDVVLLDVNLGTASGLDVHRELRSLAERRPAVVFMTSRRDVFPAIVPALGPADDWIIKPWDTAELVARVRLAVRRAGERRAPPTRSEPSGAEANS
jgi:two-component system catabolic regulation response regulator CreB